MPAKVNQILKELNTADGVHESVLVGRDGFVIDHAGDMDADNIGAIISTAIGAVESLGRNSQQGDLFEVMAEYKDGVIIAAPVGRDAVLGVVARTGSNLGGIRFAVKKNIRELERTL